MIEPIAINSIQLAGNEKQYLNDCIDASWISGEGPFIEKFEKHFAEHIGRKYGIAVSSGSAALDIAMMAAGITEGDEVIMPAFTIISPALSVVRLSAIPVLVDSDPLTYNMDVSLVEAKITSRTKAILIVHIYGLPVDVQPLIDLAKKYNLLLIEDAAEMNGQTYYDKKCGSFGVISIFSFYANKLVTTGEGGMLLCDDPEIAKRCKKYRNLAFEIDKPRFIHYEFGYNYRMTSMQAALGLAQLEQVEKFVEKKRSIGYYYNEQLNFLNEFGFLLPIPSMPYAENIYWAYTLVAPTEDEKTRIISHLNSRLIATRPFFWCMHEQPVFQKMCLFEHEKYIVAEKLARCGFYIPAGLGITDREMARVVETFKEVYG